MKQTALFFAMIHLQEEHSTSICFFFSFAKIASKQEQFPSEQHLSTHSYRRESKILIRASIPCIHAVNTFQKSHRKTASVPGWFQDMMVLMGVGRAGKSPERTGSARSFISARSQLRAQSSLWSANMDPLWRLTSNLPAADLDNVFGFWYTEEMI